MASQRFVIIGAGVAGASAAEALRQRGFDGEIHLFGGEPELPYNRPSLSKAYLRGEERFEDTLVKPTEFYSTERIDLHLGTRVTRLDSRRKRIEFAGGELAYDRVLLATGGRTDALARAIVAVLDAPLTMVPLLGPITAMVQASGLEAVCGPALHKAA